MAPPDSVRVDRWLCAARIYKSRTLATQACDAGHVRVNGTAVKPSGLVRVGDEVAARAPRGPVVLRVVVLEQKRQSPARARELYEDHSPPAPSRDEYFWTRPQRKGRPTKAERRATDQLRRR
jgi:ribosome-associated heat shock protein Hsp15